MIFDASKSVSLCLEEIYHMFLLLTGLSHGTGPVAFHRSELVQALYHTLPEKSKSSILYNKKVAEIFSGDEGVRVRCTDDTTYTGSILLGADGVHSVARHWMRKLATESNKDLDWDAEELFESAYRCMWCSFPKPTESGDAFDTQHRDRSAMYLTGRERGWIFLFEKLPQPTKKRVYYNESDILAVAESFADFTIAEGLKVRDVFSKRITSGMANLEEGTAKHWSWGRIVLAGDACHKYTPNAGLGFQSGIQDVVSLCNKLQSVVSADQKEEMKTVDFTKVFESYQEERSKVALKEATDCARATRSQAWMTTALFILARYIMPLRMTNYIIINWVVAKRVSEAQVLSYVPADEPFMGVVQWRHGLPTVSKEKK